MNVTPQVTRIDGDGQERERRPANDRQVSGPGIGMALVRLVAALGALLRAARRMRRRRRAELDMLARMSPHLLADIGLRRSDLDAVMAGVVPIEQIGEPVPRGSRPDLVVLPGGRGAREGPRDLDAAA